jgi:hypothetical protein
MQAVQPVADRSSNAMRAWRAGRWLVVAVIAAAGIVPLAVRVRADEGMWTFNAPPLGRIRQAYGLDLTPEWLEHLQQSSVRFSTGGSGSFVSADGLVLTNHHVGASSIQKLGDEAHDYYRDGFTAATPAEELRCHDLELNVLISIEDVTAKVKAAVAVDMSADDAAAARRQVMAAIEQESLRATGLRSDVITLYQGGSYHLYRSKKYTDVRLVFAPEQQIAFFGGDADNFEFPRFDLDICFFRAYEDGRPARVPHHLAWARTAVQPGDVVFVSGHPGHTDRGSTVAELVSLRDRRIPAELRSLVRLESLLAAYGGEGPEERRQAMNELFGVQNARKNRQGVLAGLLDPRIFAGRRQAEQAARAAGGAAAYARIEQAQQDLDRIATRHRLLEGAAAFNSHFFANARTILRAAEERSKPNGQRLREYRDSNRESLELQLFSERPLYDSFEIVKLADSLTLLAMELGGDDELVRRILAGLSPRDRAVQLVRGTRLGRRGGPDAATPDDRRTLAAGGAAAVAASRDPMIELARLVDAEARGLRRQAEAAAEIKQQAHAELAQARFAREGDAAYPDATFTLRLASGTVRGYEEEGRAVPPITTYAGLFARATAKAGSPAFELPPRWARLRPVLERDEAFVQTPFNFVSTADIIGGNSGSPVVNRAGELVGVIFDGNIQSLSRGIVYDDAQGRAISVDAAGIVAALERVYEARGLVAEIRGGR